MSIMSIFFRAGISPASARPPVSGPWLKKTKELAGPISRLIFRDCCAARSSASSAGPKKIYGMSDGREGSRFFYHRTAKVDRREHAIERYLKLAELAGAKVGDALRCPLPTGDPLPRFDEYPPFILLHPFRARRKKSLSNAVIEEFCAAFAPTRVVLVGKVTAQDRAEPDNCVDLTNQTTLLQLVRLIRVARFVISVDSGPMHIAAAIAQNLLSIHTWTDPRRVGPYNPDAWIWKNGKILRISELEGAKIRTRRPPV